MLMTVRVSEHALAHYGAMPHAPCNKSRMVLSMSMQIYEKSITGPRIYGTYLSSVSF